MNQYSGDKEQRLQQAVSLYEQIREWYACTMQKEEILELITAFDEAFPEFQWFSDVEE